MQEDKQIPFLGFRLDRDSVATRRVEIMLLEMLRSGVQGIYFNEKREQKERGSNNE